MAMRPLLCAFSLVVCGTVATSRADTFSGFSGVDRPYLVNQDRVCTPIVVVSSAAVGAPKCDRTAADAIARLSIKPPIVQSGGKATFVAQVTGRTITVSRRTGGTVVAWDAPDPVVKIVELYASQYDDRVAVAYNVRRLGKEVTDVIAFDLGQGQTQVVGTAKPGDLTDAQPAQPASPAQAAPQDPAIASAINEARAAPKAKALAKWKAVLALDAQQPEALFRIAAVELAAHHQAEAMASLQALAASGRDDAIEWLVEARFDPAFAGLRADAAFRTAVGLDRKPANPYERLMGFGGQWEQTGTSCDRPEVRLTTTHDRHFKLRVKTSCEGAVDTSSFSGTWRLDGERVVLQLPNQGKVTAADEAACRFESAGDEDAMRCSLGRDMDFVVLPARR